jgi:hypothetical protein
MLQDDGGDYLLSRLIPAALSPRFRGVIALAIATAASCTHGYIRFQP